MSTDNNPCPINHKHVIALSGAILVQLACILSEVRMLLGLAIFAGCGAMLYWICAIAPWVESYAGKGRIPIRDTNWACRISVPLFLTMSYLFTLTKFW